MCFKEFGHVTLFWLRFLFYRTYWFYGRRFTADDFCLLCLGYRHELVDRVYKPKCEETSLEISPMLRRRDLFFRQL